MTTVLLSVWTNTFCEVWNEHALGHRNLTFGWPHIAGSAYQKWPTKSQCSFSTWTWEEKKLKRKTFKCDRSYQIPGQSTPFFWREKSKKSLHKRKIFSIDEKLVGSKSKTKRSTTDAADFFDWREKQPTTLAPSEFDNGLRIIHP